MGTTTYSSGQRHAAGQEISCLGITSGHHAELVAGHEASEVVDLLLQWHLGVEVGLLVGISWLSARDVSVRETVARHFGLLFEMVDGLDGGRSIRLLWCEGALKGLDQ